MKKQFETITKEVEVEKLVENEQGEQVMEKVQEQKEYIIETIPAKEIEHEKSGYIAEIEEQIANLAMSIEMFEKDLILAQAKKVALEEKLTSLK